MTLERQDGVRADVSHSLHPSPVDQVRLDALPIEIAVPRSNGELVFDAPWHARALGMAIVTCRDGQFEWDEFRSALSDEIARTGQTGADEYYSCWLSALVRVLSGVVEPVEMAHREGEFQTGVRDDVF